MKIFEKILTQNIVVRHGVAFTTCPMCGGEMEFQYDPSVGIFGGWVCIMCDHFEERDYLMPEGM